MTVEAGEHAVADVGIRYRGPSSTLSACFDTACITSLLPPRPRNLMSASNLPPFLRLWRLNATRQCGRHPSRRSHGSKAGHVQEASRQRDLHDNAQDLETGQFVTVISPSQRSSRPPSRPPTLHVGHHHHHDRSVLPIVRSPPHHHSPISVHHPPIHFQSSPPISHPGTCKRNPAALALPCLPAYLHTCLPEPCLTLRFALPPGAIFPLSPSPLTHQCHPGPTMPVATSQSEP